MKNPLLRELGSGKWGIRRLLSNPIFVSAKKHSSIPTECSPIPTHLLNGVLSKSSSATLARASKRLFNVLCRGHSTAYSYLAPVC